ncbi:hypothetical protein [Microbacterium trichothecenolyticum]|uniref:Uncharacterized protein n=1 Tax=Microbacterium trichothecenolyticum TaxID=69370 RepID=A0A0M2HMC1_MICTR|nr:hypothetical protein [Microbacterium trichothecenolyticum]KJL45598.1 hypothetical protein RS82_00150 [Microbacterium trichothecenolyticum]
MSRRPRTPVYWPRMKVRGRRNRAKLAARYTTRQIVRVVFDGIDTVNGGARFRAAPPGQATHMLAIDGPTRDGYGRIVKSAPAPRVQPKPKPTPERSWSMGFNLTGDTSALRDLLFGKEGHVNATG